MKRSPVFTYLDQYGSKTLKEEPFNEVDGIVLCSISYLNFEPFLPRLEKNKDGIAIGDLQIKGIEDELMLGAVTPKKDLDLFKKCQKCPRYSSLKMNHIFSNFDKDSSIQFFAMTFAIDDFIIVTYRGTDSSIVGWKENFMMGLKDAIPAYSIAKNYLEKISTLFIDKKLILIGHSKGGALASYAAIFIQEDLQSSIHSVYNYDGPGFCINFNDSFHQKEIYNNIHKYIPTDSIVGILLETDFNVKVISAYSISVMQHSLYQWKIENNHFIYKPKKTNRSQSFQYYMKTLLSRLTDSEKKQFIDLVFNIIEDMKVESIFDFKQSITKHLYSAAKSINFILKDPEKKGLLKNVIKSFILSYPESKKNLKGKNKKTKENLLPLIKDNKN